MAPSIVITFILSLTRQQKSLYCAVTVIYYLHSWHTPAVRATWTIRFFWEILDFLAWTSYFFIWNRHTSSSRNDTLRHKLAFRPLNYDSHKNGCGVWWRQESGFWPGRGWGGEVAVVFSAPLDLLMGSSPAETSIASVRYLYYRTKETNEKVTPCHIMSHQVIPFTYTFISGWYDWYYERSKIYNLEYIVK